MAEEFLHAIIVISGRTSNSREEALGQEGILVRRSMTVMGVPATSFSV